MFFSWFKEILKHVEVHCFFPQLNLIEFSLLMNE